MLLADRMGKRFIPLLYVILKPLIPLKIKNLLFFHIIDKLYNSGIRDFYFCTGYVGTYVESYIREKFKMKIKIFKFFKTENRNHPFPRSIDSLKSLLKYRGSQSSYDYAQAFMIARTRN